MEKNVCIIHYNTPELTRATIMSVLKHTPDCRIVLFDNSDRRPFVSIDGVRIIDNTKGLEIDFDKLIESFPGRRESDNNYGSAKHCYTVNYCFKFFDDGFLLLDPDVLVKNDLTPLFDDSVIWVGKPHKTKKHKVNIERLYPFCCYINTRICKDNGIHYFDNNHMWQLSGTDRGSWYDTGAWFLEATRQFDSRVIYLGDYITHYGSASFRKTDVNNWKEWLEMNKRYWL